MTQLWYNSYYNIIICCGVPEEVTMQNPFHFRELPVEAPFCNRQVEIKELLSHASNAANVVLFSPRRYGKTSLVKKVQQQLSKKKLAAIYMDFFGIDSVDDMSARLASRVFSFCHGNEPLFKKAIGFLSVWRPVLRPDPEYGISLTVEPTARKKGVELLEDTLSGLGRFIKDYRRGCHIVFDEFQEIVELRESLQVEGIMRSHIQTHANASYFFVGSRRRILNDIFNEKKRPFYRSAINYPLPPLPSEEAAEFILEQFRRSGKVCPQAIATRIVEAVRGYPYYIQRIPYSVFEISGKRITEEDYTKGFRKALEGERPVYEALLQSLSLQQIKIISALADQVTESPYSAEYMARHGLGSVGGLQGALKKLMELDYIEQDRGVFQVVDPVFGIWLRHLKEGS
ncbi:MAG TPA: ATP-binding protein [Nitrospiraceae bacterium]|jgi:AAA+ ATPase superfamily predicted ATPase|nr:ATP-binding protein [Nitrospiraceae bacterium]